ncbi:ATP synthase F1 subunit epsilon [Sinanaerobacter chloroacetimidivorans]|jgi:F-type H+-transporting ATPase subunit epsilon|uniref:ATP synthase epsilon chain n=1 Tax=Sinanaerobacter chloroacetimidivorans TaxID=2818044 RepID=A0A8J7W579_9FIRM|nr:ATP synthase F1 subunit epsilon [Sinanaerobacter chloroacetimidivorans]MBR0599180.1 ATP synthase F1 subunit epsilon [Sinanaerobacter chloroacetimidivorans]
MAKSMLLEVITPSKLFYKGEVELVIVRTLTGDEGFMAGHTWAVKLLDAGELWIQEAGSKEFKVAALAGGYVDVKDDVVIFTDAAEWPEDIDLERAKNEKAKAEEWLCHPTNDDYEIARAKIAIAKSLTRMNVKAGGIRRKK